MVVAGVEGTTEGLGGCGLGVEPGGGRRRGLVELATDEGTDSGSGLLDTWLSE